jgi:hypothetical protein
MFGAMRLSHGGTVQALLVPDEAIQSDQARKTVLVVAPDGTLTAKPVILGPVVRGLRVIRSGLAPTDRVAITNLQAAMPGAKVNTRPATITALPAQQPTAIATRPPPKPRWPDNFQGNFPMRFSRFFIDRPIFAAVLAVLITVVGALAFVGLPVSQYPEVVPPTVTVSAQYPGASAETVAATVATPIEQEINGVDNMLYMSSQSTGDGKVTITATFKIGTDLDAAQVLVQNRVAIAVPRLPQEVQRLGVVTRKTSPDFLMVVNLQSPDGSLPRDYISNYALTQVRRLARLDGVGDVQLLAARLCDARVDRSCPRRRAQPDGGRDRCRPARTERAGVFRRSGPAPIPKARLSSLAWKHRAA